MEFKRFVAAAQSFDIPQRYTPISFLGGGTYGCVCSAKDSLTGQIVAIKKIKSPSEHAANPAIQLIVAKRLYREVALLSSLHHENVIEMSDAFGYHPSQDGQDFPDIYVVISHMEADLDQIIHSKQPLSVEHIRYIMYQTLCGLNYLHKMGVIHRDIKPQNVLVNSDTTIKLCDFGLSCATKDEFRTMEQQQERMSNYVVTRQYRPPEIILECARYGFAADIWSAGCIMAELFLRQPLFQGSDYADQLHRVISILGTPNATQIPLEPTEHALRYLMSLPHSKGIDMARVIPIAPPDALDLMRKMIVFHPDARLTAEQALRHPFFAPLFDEEDLFVEGAVGPLQESATVEGYLAATAKIIQNFVPSSRTSTPKTTSTKEPSSPAEGAMTCVGPSPAPRTDRMF